MKIKLSLDGRNNTGTWDVTAQEYHDRPNLSIERGTEAKTIYFDSQDEVRRFSQGVQLCRAKDENGKEVYVSAFK